MSQSLVSVKASRYDMCDVINRAASRIGGVAATGGRSGGELEQAAPRATEAVDSIEDKVEFEVDSGLRTEATKSHMPPHNNEMAKAMTRIRSPDPIPCAWLS